MVQKGCFDIFPILLPGLFLFHPRKIERKQVIFPKNILLTNMLTVLDFFSSEFKWFFFKTGKCFQLFSLHTKNNAGQFLRKSWICKSIIWKDMIFLGCRYLSSSWATSIIGVWPTDRQSTVGRRTQIREKGTIYSSFTV